MFQIEMFGTNQDVRSQRGAKTIWRLEIFWRETMDNRIKEIVENFDQIKIGLDDPFKFHCTMCGKCCINREDILLTPRDIYNMSKELGMQPGDFFHAYCENYIGSNSRMPIVRLKPRGSVQRCPLLKDRKCSVHKAKPVVCAMFPIGRGIRTEGDVEKNTLAEYEIEYIFNDPGCGDNSETHTVREWLNEFGISIDDKFFLKWSNIIRELGAVFRKAEGKVKDSLMENVWTLTFVKLYLAYDMEKDFLPQFEENSEDLLALMQFMPIPKGGEK